MKILLSKSFFFFDHFDYFCSPFFFPWEILNLKGSCFPTPASDDAARPFDKRMLRLSLTALGKWKGWDHIKGMNKAKGSVHIRHVLGSGGKYKRWSKHYGMRDGTRSAINHIRGGLGVKIGGGLFGARIPRQHALKTMTREDLELELNGHPNITNPYRLCLEEHPALDLVKDLPRLRLAVLVAMPPAGGSLRSSASPGLPLSWATVLREVDKGLAPLLEICESMQLTFATHRCCSTTAAAVASSKEAVELLLRQHTRGIPLRGPAQRNHRPSAMFASNFSSPRVASSGAPLDSTSGLHAALSALRQQHPSGMRLQCRLSADPQGALAGVADDEDGKTASCVDALKFWMYSHDSRGPFSADVSQQQRALDATLVVEAVTASSLNRQLDADGPEAVTSIFNSGTRLLLAEQQYLSVKEPLDLVAAAIQKFWQTSKPLVSSRSRELKSAAVKHFT
jgi:hypothetical protein